MKIVNTYLVMNSGHWIHKVHELENGQYVIEKQVGAGLFSSFSLENITKERFEELKTNWK